MNTEAQLFSLFTLSPKITLFPVVHGSGDFTIELRRIMLNQKFDALAVPLPQSFQQPVEQALQDLPIAQIVYQQESFQEFSSGSEAELPTATYVPIEPCQPVITALRFALQEHLPRYFIDPEVESFEVHSAVLPDPYAVKQLASPRFAAATLPLLGSSFSPQLQYRAAGMVDRLRQLEKQHASLLILRSYAEWMAIRAAYQQSLSLSQFGEEIPPEAEVRTALVTERSLIFMMGELPHLCAQYEIARRELEQDDNLSIDGMKQLLLETRDHYRSQQRSNSRPVTPKLLKIYLNYVRNLSLIERRLTPDLYTLVTAAQQIFSDQFAVHLAETARQYPFIGRTDEPRVTMGIDQMRTPDGQVYHTKSRLPGHPISWRTCRLQSPPDRPSKQKWLTTWNPYSQCSWPPEDQAIERFRTHVKDHALSLLGHDLARIEKFTTSLKDGLDIRETLRNWHTGELYVRELPPVRGSLDCVIMLFDSPADPREYPHRITWHAEHQDESTLAFYSTDFLKEMVGPGIALGRYGGALFLFPPRPIPDIWRNPRFDVVDTLEERLLIAGCTYSREKHVAILSDAPPGRAWKMLAKKYGKVLIHVPLRKFSQQTVSQLRMFHVLNGQHVRSYAAHFIRKS